MALLKRVPRVIVATPSPAYENRDYFLGAQVVIEGGWMTFGTSFGDADVVKEFSPEDPEGEQIEGLKESLGDDVFSAIAGATGMDKRPSSLARGAAASFLSNVFLLTPPPERWVFFSCLRLHNERAPLRSRRTLRACVCVCLCVAQP